MARTSKAQAKLERIAPTEGSIFTTLSREELLSHPDPRGAADELYRRAHNKRVKKLEAIAA